MLPLPLHLWDIPQPASCTILNVAENITVLVRGNGAFRSVLRIHRPGYQTAAAIRSELAWIRDLRAACVVNTPAIMPGCNGDDLQTGRVTGPDDQRFMVMFSYSPGHHPDETGDLTALFAMLGTLAARLHDHASRWHLPEDFARPRQDCESLLGAGAPWGDWRAAPNMTHESRQILHQAEHRVREHLLNYGMQEDRFGLIHADMRLANILTHQNTNTLIDFDDCGFGWLLADFASAVSFLENRPDLNTLWCAWCQGYHEVRALPPDHAAIMPALIMLRRLALLAWVGSRSESSEPQKLAPGFATDTARVARRYIRGRLLD